MASSAKRKRVQSLPPNKRLRPPGGLATSDDQGSSEPCVRFSVAKAIASHLFLNANPQIDIDQNQIRTSLVQAIGNKRRNSDSGEKFELNVCDPMVCDGVSLLLQDIENTHENAENKSWWEVTYT